MEYKNKKSKIRRKGDSDASKFKPSKAGEALFVAIIEDAIRRGDIDPTKASHINIFEYIDSTLIPNLRRKEKFIWAIDHRGTILKEARSYIRYGKFELALLLYATWIEHFINGLLEGAARKKGFGHHEIPDLIRDIPLRGKFSWLLQLFDLPSISAQKRRYIDQIMQSRNSFIHYKWRFAGIDDHSIDIEISNLLKPIEQLVTYLKAYENRHILRYSPRRLRKLLNEKRKALREEGSASSTPDRSEK